MILSPSTTWNKKRIIQNWLLWPQYVYWAWSHERKREMAWDTGNKHQFSLSLVRAQTGGLLVSVAFSTAVRRARISTHREQCVNTLHNLGEDYQGARKLGDQCRWLQSPRISLQPPSFTVSQHPVCTHCGWVPGKHMLQCPRSLPKSRRKKQWGKTAWKQTVGAAEFSSEPSATNTELQPQRCEQAVVLQHL